LEQLQVAKGDRTGWKDVSIPVDARAASSRARSTGSLSGGFLKSLTTVSIDLVFG